MKELSFSGRNTIVVSRQLFVHTKHSYFECQSGGVHGSNSLPGSSKYVCRNFCSSVDGTVWFGNPEVRFANASTTTSVGKQGNSTKIKAQCFSDDELQNKSNVFDSPGAVVNFISTKYLSSSNSLAIWICRRTSPVQ